MSRLLTRAAQKLQSQNAANRLIDQAAAAESNGVPPRLAESSDVPPRLAESSDVPPRAPAPAPQVAPRPVARATPSRFVARSAPQRQFAKGGYVRAADGIAQRGKTKGRMV